LRHRFRRYFYAGQMARPPGLVGEIPKVTADWQWSGEWPVTTDALMTGAWAVSRPFEADYAPVEIDAVFLVVNVGDQPVTARLDFDGADYTFLRSGVSRVEKITAEGPEESTDTPAPLERELTFPPRTAWAWEVKAKIE
jgi:hypothetical protein